MSKRILVTGAAGKVGQAFIARLLADPRSRAFTVVRALCHNRKLPARDRGWRWSSGSIEEPRQRRRARWPA